MTYRREYQRKVESFYTDAPTRAIMSAEQLRTGENRSELFRRIVAEWQATQTKVAEYEAILQEVQNVKLD